MKKKRTPPFDLRERNMKRKAKQNVQHSWEKKAVQTVCTPDYDGNRDASCIYILLVLALSDLGSLDSRHFLSPALSRLGLLDGAEVISREA